MLLNFHFQEANFHFWHMVCMIYPNYGLPLTQCPGTEGFSPGRADGGGSSHSPPGPILSVKANDIKQIIYQYKAKQDTQLKNL